MVGTSNQSVPEMAIDIQFPKKIGLIYGASNQAVRNS